MARKQLWDQAETGNQMEKTGDNSPVRRKGPDKVHDSYPCVCVGRGGGGEDDKHMEQPGVTVSAKSPL